MKRSRFLSFLLAIAIGGTAGLPVASLSDDTDVYVGSEELAQVQGVRPNVLIILDTSGSMSTTVPGTGKSRMTNMKEALQSILDGLNNVNVGLMRFSNPGGPILFPVAYIDADASEAFTSGDADIIARIADGSDDVEELKSTGQMNVTSTRLELLDTPAFDGEASLNAGLGVGISDGADDVEEIGTSLRTTSGEMNMGTDGTVTRVDGLVFRNLALPNGAYVLGADVLFTAAQSDSGDTSLGFRGWATDDAGTFSTILKPSSVPLTNSAVVMSGMAPWTKGQTYATDDLSPVVQEIVGRPGWASGNDLGLLVTGTGLRRARTYESTTTHQQSAKLRVTYGTGSSGEQRVGLRFRSLGIPQGATIDSAVLELSPSRTLNGPVTFRIHGEKVPNAGAFDTAPGSMESMANKLARRTSANVEWSAATEWVARSAQGNVQSSPDLSPILQEIVNQADWCGGNDVALLLEKVDGISWRAVYSKEGDPNFAPTLKINYTYNPETAPANTGCMVQTIQRQVTVGTDDAEQGNSSGAMRLSDSSLDMPYTGSTAQTTGVRFQDVRLEPGVEVLDARLVFTAYSSSTSGASMVFFGEAADNSAGFTATANNLSASKRPTTTASVTWGSASNPLTGWNAGDIYTTPDLKSIVQEIVNRPAWQSGNALSFIVKPGSGQRRAYSYNGSPGNAPILKITYKGRVTASSGSSLTVRQLLKQTVNSLQAGGWTPIVDTLYEAARYYRGEGIVYGKTRGVDGSTVERNTRVSHPASYTGGTVYRESGCTDADMSAVACRSERINGNPVYVSPIKELCGSNYIILLTDGEANYNHSANLIRSLAGIGSCQAKLSDDATVLAGEQCGIDLGRFLYTKDQLSVLAGSQTVVTYTIGFNLDASDPEQVHAVQFLKDLAKDSGGQFRPATTAADLAETFQAFFLDILNRSTSFAAPALSVNAFNKLYHRDDVYFSLFQPSDRIGWAGNVKKYRLRSKPSQCPGGAFTDECRLGEVLDKFGEEAIGPDGRIKDVISSFWSFQDGDKLQKGGSGNAGPVPANRRVITFTGSANPAGDNLGSAAHEVKDTNSLLTNTMLGLGVAATAEARSALISWVRGFDVDEENDDGDVRYSFGDPLHSSPQAVTYGGSDAAPVTKLFVGTNDGGLRMIDGETGEEEWIFYPPETLSLQSSLRSNPNGRHVYGIDGTPTVWLKDGDGDGTIRKTDGDFVRVIVGMRRGGNHYYALDVTPGTPLEVPGTIAPTYPEYLWRIDGGSADYPQLGQTWSRPTVATVRVGSSTAGVSEARQVLIFAGGYDESQDTAFGESTTGNAIYIADPLTGERKYWISGTAHSEGSGVYVPGMNYPIPSDISVLDADGDGAVDRIFVGDTGGQLWRVDLAPVSGSADGLKAVVGKLATVASSASEADKRKFFYPPDVVQVLDSKYSNVPRYDLVTIATGDREHPLSEAVSDRLYAFRDIDYGPMADANGDGLADSYPSSTSGVPLQGALDGPPDMVAGDLFDATNVPQIESEGGGTANLTALQQARGWYVRFEGSGEKGLASPIVLAGKLFITTFVPQATEIGDTCQLMEGGGRLYGVDVLNAEPKFNWDGLGEIESPADRRYQLAAGIPSGAVPIFQQEGVTLLVGVGGGAETVDPQIALPRAHTYWFQGQ